MHSRNWRSALQLLVLVLSISARPVWAQDWRCLRALLSEKYPAGHQILDALLDLESAQIAPRVKKSSVLGGLAHFGDPEQIWKQAVGEATELGLEDLDRFSTEVREGLLTHHFDMQTRLLAHRNPTPLGELQSIHAVEGFLDAGVRRRALFEISELGGFKERLDAFFDEMVSRPRQARPRQLILRDGTKVEISAHAQGVVLLHGDTRVEVKRGELFQRDSPSAARPYIISATGIESKSFLSSLEYRTRTHQETADRARAVEETLVQDISALSPKEKQRLLGLLQGVLPDLGSENPKQLTEGANPKRKSEPPKIVPAKRDLNQVPLIPYASRTVEARERISVPDVNSGVSLKGFEILAQTLDQLYMDGAHQGRIKTISKLFGRYQREFVRDYVIAKEAVRKYQILLRGVDSGRLKEGQAMLVDRSGIQARFQGLSQELYYDPHPGDPNFWSGLPARGKYLTLRAGHWFQVVSVDELNRGGVNIYLRNLQQRDSKGTYHFQMDAEGRIRVMIDDSSAEGYLALNSLLGSLDD